MRGPTPRDISGVRPPELRKNKANDAHQALREKILSGVYTTDQIMNPKDIEKEYGINNTSVQIILLRLAIEGLIKIQPLREKVGPNNAAYNEYHVMDLNVRHRILSTRHDNFVSDISQSERSAFLQTEILEVQRADEEIAQLLEVEPGKNVIFHRTLQKSDENTVIAISDAYFPFWLVEALPELKEPKINIHQIMRQLGRDPYWCTETVDVVQASSLERKMFTLSSDDAIALFKIIRRVFDKDGAPLLVDFLTDRGDKYRLHYSFPLYTDSIPPRLRAR